MTQNHRTVDFANKRRDTTSHMVKSSISCLCAFHHYNNHIVPAHTGSCLLFVPIPSTCIRVPSHNSRPSTTTSFPSSLLLPHSVELIMLWQAFYRLLLVATLIAASSAMPLNDEVLPEDNHVLPEDNQWISSLGDDLSALKDRIRPKDRLQKVKNHPQLGCDPSLPAGVILSLFFSFFSSLV